MQFFFQCASGLNNLPQRNRAICMMPERSNSGDRVDESLIPWVKLMRVNVLIISELPSCVQVTEPEPWCDSCHSVFSVEAQIDVFMLPVCPVDKAAQYLRAAFRFCIFPCLDILSRFHFKAWRLFSPFLPVPHQSTGVREEQLLVTVLPGLPTAAEFFLLPDKQLTEGKPEKSSAHLDQVRQPLLCLPPHPVCPVSNSQRYHNPAHKSEALSSRVFFLLL